MTSESVFGAPPPPDPVGAINAAATAGIITSVFIVIVATVAVFYCLCILDKRLKNRGIATPSINIGSRTVPAQPISSGILYLPIEVRDRLQKLQYTYAEVLYITKNLNIKLGEGGFGPVYFGKLKDGSPVAVKTLSSMSTQGTQEFLNEVEVLSRAHHKNLVSFVGYCYEANERCLIYEFMPKGTLGDRLHGLPSEQEPLNWVTRLRIAVGAAKGFNYLHNDCSPAIIHRDVKCSNILLNNNLAAKVADFGLSKLLSPSALTHITTRVMGTYGYLDPEYARTERLTEKSDVYSFGVILLELLTGNKAVMQHNGEYVPIAQWAGPHIKTNMTSNILDKKLGKNIDKDAVQTVANIAMHCVASKGIERPSFQEVLEVLEATLKQLMKLELPQQTVSRLATDDIIDIQARAETVIPIVDRQNEEDNLLNSVQKTV